MYAKRTHPQSGILCLRLVRNGCPKQLTPKASNWRADLHFVDAGKALAEEKGRSKVMPLIQVLEVLVVVGVLLWLVNRFIPMQSTIKSILNGIVVIAVVLWLLNVFGLFHSLSGIRVGKG